jgi:glyoxylase-like metal-dependent hydrolase (beta-lactamase superfamily II)
MKKLYTRRATLIAGAGLILGGGTYMALGMHNADRARARTMELPPQKSVTITTASGIRVHGIQTGWISIKRNHYRLNAPDALRFPSIVADLQWTEPKPMLSWVLEHPEGLIVVDSGERAGANDLPTYVACADPLNRTIITGNFRVHVLPEMELGAQLRTLGLSGRDVRWVVQTHLHFDHANGFAFVPRAEVLVARAELEGHRAVPVGALSCLYPSGFEPKALEYQGGTFANFAQHHALTRAGDVLVLPTPGHSYGHQSVLLRDLERSYLFAGDVVFDEGQLREREIAGIVHDVAQSRSSLEAVRAYAATHPTVVLPSHDPDSLRRLQDGQVTRIG